MALNTTQEKIIKIAAVLGFIQGFAWMIMSVIVIILHYRDMETIDEIITVEETYNYLIELLFIRDTFTDIFGHEFTIPKPDMTVDPSTFCSFMFIYLFASTYWVLTSSALFRAIHKRDFKNARKPGNAYVSAVLITSLVDFILVCLLGSDYSNCELTFCIPIGIVMTIAAKGFVLWGLNVVLGLVVQNYLKEISNPSHVQTVVA